MSEYHMRRRKGSSFALCGERLDEAGHTMAIGVNKVAHAPIEGHCEECLDVIKEELEWDVTE